MVASKFYPLGKLVVETGDWRLETSADPLIAPT